MQQIVTMVWGGECANPAHHKQIQIHPRVEAQSTDNLNSKHPTEYFCVTTN